MKQIIKWAISLGLDINKDTKYSAIISEYNLRFTIDITEDEEYEIRYTKNGFNATTLTATAGQAIQWMANFLI